MWDALLALTAEILPPFIPNQVPKALLTLSTIPSSAQTLQTVTKRHLISEYLLTSKLFVSSLCHNFVILFRKLAYF